MQESSELCYELTIVGKICGQVLELFFVLFLYPLRIFYVLEFALVQLPWAAG